MQATFRLFMVPSAVICLVVTCGLAEAIDEPKSFAEVAGLLSSLADLNEANYSSIDTWKADYDVELTFPSKIKTFHQGNEGNSTMETAIWKKHCRLSFVLDAVSERLWVEIVEDVSKREIIDAQGKTREMLDVLVPQHQRVIVRDGRRYFMDVTSPRGPIQGFPEDPYLDTPDEGGTVIEMRALNDVFQPLDPREMFRVGGRRELTDETLRMYGSTISGKGPAEYIEKFRSGTKFEVLSGASGSSECMIQFQFPPKGSGIGDRVTERYACDNGLPMEYEFWSGEAGKTIAHREWKYESFGGVYIPKDFRDAKLDRVGNVTEQLIWHLSSATINESIDESCFELPKLSPKNGDRLVNYTERSINVWSESANRFEKPNFPSKSVSPPPTVRSKNYVFVIGSIFLLGIGLFVVGSRFFSRNTK